MRGNCTERSYFIVLLSLLSVFVNPCQGCKPDERSEEQTDSTFSDKPSIKADIGSLDYQRHLLEQPTHNNEVCYKEGDKLNCNEWNERGSVIEIGSVEHLKNLTVDQEGPHVTVIFPFSLKERWSEFVPTFLAKYTAGALILKRYDISLASVNCDEVFDEDSCDPTRVNQFCYGYKRGIRKIPFPLHTIATVDALVASFLHFSMIDLVPIIRRGDELSALKYQCYQQSCDILLASLPALGNYDHRAFLEAIYSYLHSITSRSLRHNSWSFAITTTLLPDQELASSPDDRSKPQVWLLQCSMGEECITSRYSGHISPMDLLKFIRFIDTPFLVKLDLHLPSLPHLQFDKSLVLFVFSVKEEERTVTVAKQLAQIIRGSAATALLIRDLEDKSTRDWLGIEEVDFPAICFFPPEKVKVSSCMTHFEDALRWVEDQLASVSREGETDEENTPEEELGNEEAKDDDKVSLSMVPLARFSETVPAVEDLEELKEMGATGQIVVVAYTYSWDPPSNLLLQHLSSLTLSLPSLPTPPLLRHVDCQSLPRACEGRGKVPSLWVTRQNVTLQFRGVRHASAILRFITMLDQNWNMSELPVDSIPRFLNMSLNPSLSGVAEAAVLAILPQRERVNAPADFESVAAELRGRLVRGMTLATEQQINRFCGPSFSSGCAIVSKPGDLFQKSMTLPYIHGGRDQMVAAIEKAARYTVTELHPHSILSLSDSKGQILPLTILFVNSSDVCGLNAMMRERYPRYCSDSIGVQNSLVGQEVFLSFGEYAKNHSNENQRFCWIPRTNSMAASLLASWPRFLSGWCPSSPIVASIDVRKGQLRAHCLENGDEVARLALMEDGENSFTVPLSKREWFPSLHGLDYLKLMEEDQETENPDSFS